MKKTVRFVFIGVLLTGLSFGQSSLRFDFSRLAWGYNFGILTVDPTIVNSNLDSMQITSELGSNMPLNGIGGWIAVNDRWRIGALGMMGNLLVSGQSEESDLFRQVDLNFRVVGPTLETVFNPKFIKNFELTFGSMVGFGRTTLRLYEKDGNLTWDDMWAEYTDSFNAAKTTKQLAVSANAVILYPWIGVRYADFLDLMTVGLEAGYLFGQISEEDWRVPYGKVSNANNFDLSNLLVKTTVYFGN